MLRGVLTTLPRSTDAAGIFVVGGVLTLLTWVLIPVWLVGTLAFPPLVALAPLAIAPALVARGYFVRHLADGIETGNAEGAAAFVAWNDLYRAGAKSALLSAALLAPLALLVALVAAAGASLVTGTVDPGPIADGIERALGDGGVAAVVGLGSGLLVVVSAAYLLAFAYVRPAALASFAASGRLRDGLRPKRVAMVAGSGEYATAWVVAAATLAAGYALAGPLVPLVMGAAFVFVFRVIAHGLYGRGAASALADLDADRHATLDTNEAVAGDEIGRFHDLTGGVDGTGGAGATVRSGARAERVGDEVGSASPEAPPTVQSGRTVPFGDSVVGADGGSVGVRERTRGGRGDVHVAGGEDSGHVTVDEEGGHVADTGGDDGFEWNARLDPGVGRDRDRDAGSDDGGFEWESGVTDGEDKS